jgi:branched-chain amino acid transport system substrate-binding protein
MGGDALVISDFWKITGDAGKGTLMTFPPDPRNMPTAAPVVAEFKQQNYDPEGYTLYTYAAVQAFAQAAVQANSVKIEGVSKALHSGRFNTVLGSIGFNDKGDVIGPSYVAYLWQDGSYSETKM